jgi:hypothetical protein
MGFRVSLIAGAVILAVWAIIGLIVPLGAGWVHLLLAVGVLLLMRGVVLWPPRGDA